MADLVQHLTEVYLHKAEVMRAGAWPPRSWEPELPGDDPLSALDGALAGLLDEFAARSPEAPTLTWYAPEQNVGFWIRRMAQETVIHRVDAELAAGVPLAEIPDDLAVDGVDEVLVRFLAHGSREWVEDFGDSLADCDGRSVVVTAGTRRWLVRLTPNGVDVDPLDPGAGDTGAGEAGAAGVSGSPVDVLLWLWRRTDDDAISLSGDRALIVKLRELLGYATL